MKAKRILCFIGLGILALLVVVSFFPSLFTSYGLKESFGVWQTPSMKHIFGCNDMGYDIYTEIVYGTRNTLLTGVCATLLTMTLGTFFGYLSAEDGMAGRIADGIMNVFVLVPKLVVLIVLSAFLQGGRWMVILLIGLFSWCPVAREVKAECIRLKTMPFMDSLVLAGHRKPYIALRHVLPNLRDVLSARGLLSLTSSIMMESSLSFLGLGDTYHASWGTMMNFAWKRGAIMNGAWLYMLVPGFMIAAVALSVYFVSFYLEAKKDYVKEVH